MQTLSHHLVYAIAGGLLYAGIAMSGCQDRGSSPPPAGAAPASSSASAASSTQLQDAVDQRKRLYLEAVASGSVPGGEGYYNQLAKLGTGIGTVDMAPLNRAVDFINGRPDTADFKASFLLRLLYLHGNHPALPGAFLQRAERALLDFKYWIDEPGTDGMIFWSENHQILFAACEYLAGQLYPQQVFTNSGLTGAEHQIKAHARIIRWCNRRLRYGFSEWCSPVYYAHDLAPLLNLIDFAHDAHLRKLATMVVDVLVFDLARLTHKGSFGVSAGRAYGEHKRSGSRQADSDTIEMLFGTRGHFTHRNSTSGGSFATSFNYRPPSTLLAIGQDHDAEFTDRARYGVSFSEGQADGIGFTTLADGMFWWGMGAYLAPETIVLSRRMLNTWNLWHYDSFKFLRPLRSLPDAALIALSATLSPLSRGSVLSTANVTTYRSPHGMLSSVQSWRKGQVGFQANAWQATLGLDAVVFTTAPGTLGRQGPDFWSGSSSMPRAIQADNVVALLYNPNDAIRQVFPKRTHAYFPRAAFDKVVEAGNWIFGRKADGYVGLYSAAASSWTTSGPWAQKERVAHGARNIWVCQLGSRRVYPQFADFVSACSQAQITTTGAGNSSQSRTLELSYHAPGLGHLEIAWNGTPTLNGQALYTGTHPRFDNPYCQMNLGDSRWVVKHNNLELVHDYNLVERSGDGL